MRQSRKLGLFGGTGNFVWNKYSFTRTYDTSLSNIVRIGTDTYQSTSTSVVWYGSSSARTTISSIDGTFTLRKSVQLTSTNYDSYYTDNNPTEQGTASGNQTIRIITNWTTSWYSGATITYDIYKAGSQTTLNFIETVTSKNSSAYPWNGEQDGYYYKIVPWEEITFSGDCSSSYILGLDNIYYKFYKITNSGTINTPKTTKTHLWICGPGGNGGSANYYKYGGGGGGGYFVNSSNVKFNGPTLITIGQTAGTDSSFGSIVAPSGNNGGNSSGTSTSTGTSGSGGNGGSGGGAGGYRYSGVTQGINGTGQHESSIPFYDTQLSSSIFSSFTTPLCPGGNGGNYQSTSYVGKGYLGGENGADASEINTKNASGESATIYGGGGSGARATNTSTFTAGGAGYQGICYLAMPVKKLEEKTVTLHVSDMAYSTPYGGYEDFVRDTIGKSTDYEYSGSMTYERFASGLSDYYVNYYFDFSNLNIVIVKSLIIKIKGKSYPNSGYTDTVELFINNAATGKTVTFDYSAITTKEITDINLTAGQLKSTLYLHRTQSTTGSYNYRFGHIHGVDFILTYLS